MEEQEKPAATLGTVKSQWGEADTEHFGYDSEEDRKTKRGLEDWELVERIPESQRPVPYWFFAIIGVVLLIAIGLSFPFWGRRPGDTRPWLDWGFLIALVYIAAAGSFVWFMVRMYGSSSAGRLDSDPEKTPQKKSPDDG